MNTFEIDASIGSSGIASSGIASDDVEQPFLEVAGIEGSSLRATPAGLTVYQGGVQARDLAGQRRWTYDQLREVRLDAYGSVGVIRATVSSTGGALPLLLLEPEQIAAARRTLEIIWNLMASNGEGLRTA
jgi:hypothetical protein